MLDVTGLSRRYAEFVAVDNVSFSIAQGEIVGLLGHNGAGKTTIMKMLSGYLEPHAGQVRIDGRDLAVDTKHLQRRLGYLPENLPVYPEMRVVDYLDYAAELKGLGGEHKRAAIRRAVAATDIPGKVLEPISTLSRGYKQRVGVAQAILGQPRLLILDEPTNGLDPTQTEHMRQLIRDIAREATVILSTHIMQEVDALCDRVLILNNGRLAVDEQLARLRHSNRLLLSTSAADAGERLLALQGVAQVEVLTSPQQSETPRPAHRYRLMLSEREPAQAVSAAAARAVLDSGAELYQLQLEHRDLESLFREVSQPAVGPNPEDMSHAA